MLGTTFRKDSMAFPLVDRHPRRLQELFKGLTEALHDTGTSVRATVEEESGRVVYVMLVPFREPEYGTRGFYM